MKKLVNEKLNERVWDENTDNQANIIMSKTKKYLELISHGGAHISVDKKQYKILSDAMNTLDNLIEKHS